MNGFKSLYGLVTLKFDSSGNHIGRNVGEILAESISRMQNLANFSIGLFNNKIGDHSLQ